MDRYVVSKELVSVKEEPNQKSMVVDELLYGMEITIKKRLLNGWILIKTFYGYEGYIKSDDVVAYKLEKGRNELVIGRINDIYEKPDIKSKRIYKVLRGSMVNTLIRESNGYTEVLLYSGKVGYIKTSALGEMITKGSNEISIRKNIVESAMSYLGTQYRWGGKSPEGIDCSGLCFMAYLLNGVIIWRDSYIHEGYPIIKIKLEDIKEADLLYFEGHVAMYIGNGRFIHATNRIGEDSVVIASLNKRDDCYRSDLAESILAVGSFRKYCL